MPQLTLDTPIKEIFGVGDTYAKRLKKLHIHTVKDLLYHKPARYEDWSTISLISQIQAGEKITVQGQITNFQPLITKNRKHLQVATITDRTASLKVVWFNQRYLLRVIKPGQWYSLAGKADIFNHELCLVSPEFEQLKTSKPTTIHTGRLIPIYPETAGVSSKWLRAKIHYLLERILPVPDWADYYPLKPKPLPLTEALSQLHFPDTFDLAHQAQHRLAHDELLLLHLETQHRRATWRQILVTRPLNFTSSQIKKFTIQLPFTLTKAQQQATKEILHDLQQPQPMNRLLEGDVGSGKTVVAAIAAYIASLNHTQTAIMAPTEILAQQHFQTISNLMQPFNLQVVLQTGRKKYIKKGKDKPFDIIIGTHALLSDIVNFDKLGLVVIDEQHRFGVHQRAQLIHKSHAPHTLSMTATPIPRTIALTLYGDLDISILDELPPGRIPIKTWLVPEHKRASAYDWIKTQLSAINHQLSAKPQAFIVCPFIEPSETLTTVKAAKEEFDHLKHIFSNFQLDLLHGRLKGKHKDEVIEKFATGRTQILVTTPVVEVGVDIPQATIMIIEAADRFGLAQLHQLRGRIGRAGQQAYCLLFTESDSALTRKRLKALEKTTSGLELAELDLKLRGPGQLYGTSQHGFIDLKFASYIDHQLISQTKQLAYQLYPQLKKYPLLNSQLQQRTIQPVEPN